MINTNHQIKQEIVRKIQYHYKEIEDLYTRLNVLEKQSLTCEQTNKQTGSNKVLPKGWT